MLSALLKLTLRSPREAAAMLLSAGVPRNAIWIAFVTVMILSVLVTEPLFALVPAEAFGPPMAPLTRFLLTAPFSAAMVWAIWKIGNALGGNASLSEAFLIFAYLEFVLAVGLAAMIVLVLIAPFLGGMMGLGLTLFWAWLLGVFYAEAFGYSSPFKGLGVVLLSWFVTYVAGILILSLVAGGGPA